MTVGFKHWFYRAIWFSFLGIRRRGFRIFSYDNNNNQDHWTGMAGTCDFIMCSRTYMFDAIASLSVGAIETIHFCMIPVISWQ